MTFAASCIAMGCQYIKFRA
uniref:Uncharacterized protein n=1 Tax=Rhizophora mucronata TaxID=61149 RepID=A0A2P2N2M5_RHIMU